MIHCPYLPVFLPAVLLLSTTVLAEIPGDYVGREPGGIILDWTQAGDGTWVGPDCWTNPLQDWRVRGERLECARSGGNRNIHLLTRALSAGKGTLAMSVLLGRLDGGGDELGAGWTGFAIGVRGEFNDYRDSAVRGQGLACGINGGGQLFIGSFNADNPGVGDHLQNGKTVALSLEATPAGDFYDIVLSARDSAGILLAHCTRSGVAPAVLTGGLALVASSGPAEEGNGGNRRFGAGQGRGGHWRIWFDVWTVEGTKVSRHADRSLGPVLFTQYTLSRGTVKMTAQMAPLGTGAGDPVLETRRPGGDWVRQASSPIHPLSRTAHFRIDNWDADQEMEYRVRVRVPGTGAPRGVHTYGGTIRAEPAQDVPLVMLACTGNNDLGFPNRDMVSTIIGFDPDLVFFSGDQIYEGVGGYGLQRNPLEVACLEYLRKWYLYGWGWGALLRDRPSIAIPDDHDVFHGNLWGAGGRAAPAGNRVDRQALGGYTMPADFVNMVQRTQTWHLPDPVDPVPAAQGIGVYFTRMNYGCMSFAILEDRKFKSGPKEILPEAEVWNGWAQNPDYDPVTQSDVPGAILLGERQLTFLEEWAADWSHGARMKCVLSQTIFANVATLPRSAGSDAVVPRLRILPAGEYPPDDAPVADMDSNGWPRSGRNRALHEMRRGLAFHIAGDQHLGSFIKYGIEAHGDASYAFCVPAISNVWPRRWYPAEAGLNRVPGQPRYTGDFHDGFGNPMTVMAVSNPVYTGVAPSRLHDRATGYGIIRFDPIAQVMVAECWSRYADPSWKGTKQYTGWPISVRMLENDGRRPYAYLPDIATEGLVDPVVRVINEASGEVVYTLRIRGTQFRPMVYEAGTYEVQVIDPDTEAIPPGGQGHRRFRGLVVP